MPLPKRKHSKSRSRTRHAHHALETPAHTHCTHCDAVIKPHCVCNKCGYYKDQAILKIKVKTKKDKEEKKGSE